MIDPEERAPEFHTGRPGGFGGSGCFPTLTSICCFFTPTVKPSRLSKIGFESFRRAVGSAPEGTRLPAPCKSATASIPPMSSSPSRCWTAAISLAMPISSRGCTTNYSKVDDAKAQSLLQRLDDVTRSRHEKSATRFSISNRTSRTPRRSAGLQCGAVAQPALLHRQAARLADPIHAVRRRAQTVRARTRFSDVSAVLLHLRSGRDDNLLSGGTGRSRQTRDRNVRFARTLGRRLDADLFRPRRSIIAPQPSC